MIGFKLCTDKGFHIGLSNGFTVSVQFGRGNYCEHYNDSNWQKPNEGSSFDAETAIFSPKDDLIPVNGETVQGWQQPDDVVRLLTVVARQKPTVTRIRMQKGEAVTTVIAESHGALYGFCSQACARRWRDDKGALNDNSCGASNGCWLCGRNLVTNEPDSRLYY